VSLRSVSKKDLPQALFASGGARRLVLVTCGGAFDAATHQYADNVLVTAVPAQTRAMEIATRTNVAGQQAVSVAQDFPPPWPAPRSRNPSLEAAERP
jgi:hypothetical protein